MTHRARTDLHRGILLAALLMLLGVIGLLTAAPGAAHDTLVEAEPADGATVDSPPAEVVLRYSNDVLEMGPAVLVRDAAGEVVSDAQPEVAGRSVTLPLPEDLAGGTYQVEWSVVSADGHRIQGAYSFDVAASEEPAADTGAQEAATPSDVPTTPGEPEPVEPDSTIGPAEQEPARSGLADLPGWLRLTAGVVVAGAVLTGVVVLVRRSGNGR